jgi:glycosyltransferase involved in cell wall biosynthesis
MRVGFLHTHPVQYCTPLFREMAARSEVDIQVYYCHQATPQEQSAAGFGVAFDWDTSLLGGYRHTFLNNVAAKPQIAGFWGMDVPDMGSQIASDKVDALVIHGWHYKAAWQAMAACKRQRIPFLLRSDSQLGTQRSQSTLLIKRLTYPRFIRRADGCLPTGHLSREYFLYYGAAPEKVFVVPHCVDDQRIRSEAQHWLSERDAIRAAWGITDAKIAWIFAGKFIEKKRPMDFVRVVEGLNRQDQRSVGIMIGDGPLRQECEEYAHAHDVPIKFAGFLNQSEIVRGYIAGDALILPSSAEETWGLVVNEAMLCGLPCFVSDQVGCAHDLIQCGETGDVFPFGDVASGAGVLAKYASEPLLRRMGNIAATRAHRFSVSEVSNRFIEAVRATILTEMRHPALV